MSSSSEEESGFEYRDHPADVILHGWGRTKKAAFEQAVLALFNYMTPLSGVSEEGGGGAAAGIEFDVTDAHDTQDLLYRILDEFLFRFSTELYVCRRVEIDFLPQQFAARARGWGETFVRGKHEQGTEIKAITMHNMSITEDPSSGRCDVYVLVDI